MQCTHHLTVLLWFLHGPPQFMLREFETRAPQFQQLTQAAEGILSPSGDGQQDPKDLEEVG